MEHGFLTQRGELRSAQKRNLEKGISDLAHRLVLKDQFSGVVAVSQNGGLLFSEAYGFADQTSQRHISLDTKFVIASVTQTFTAVAVAQLVEQGKLSFETPLSECLPGIKPIAARDITVHQLLTHTGGIPSIVRSGSFRKAPASFVSLQDYVNAVEAEPLTKINEYEYTDGDSILLGDIIEHVSGQSYYDYIRDHIFRVANMNDSGFDLIPPPTNLAIGYTLRDLTDSKFKLKQAKRRNNQSILPTKASPGAAAYSTAGDLIRYGTALLSHRLLSDEGTNNLLRGKIATNEGGAHAQYAYGFFDGRVGTTRVVNHGGTGPGIDVAFDLYPEPGYVVVILSNYDPPAAQQIRDELRIMIAKRML